MINIFWPYPHTNGISDQLWCLEMMFFNLRVPYTVSDRLDPISKNILIENIAPPVASYVNRFCEVHDIEVVVLPTEFLELPSAGERGLYVNGSLIADPRDDSSPFASRMQSLLEIRHNVGSFISLANQPALGAYCEIFDVQRSFDLGLPDWDIDLTRSRDSTCDYDLYFSGAPTPYRRDTLRLLENRFKVLAERRFVPEHERIRQLNRCKYNLNLIQEPGWKWLSTMRVLFALRNGKLTVQPSRIPCTALSDFVIELRDDVDLSGLVAEKLDQYGSLFSLIDLDPAWAKTQSEFIRYCEG